MFGMLQILTQQPPLLTLDLQANAYGLCGSSQPVQGLVMPQL